MYHLFHLFLCPCPHLYCWETSILMGTCQVFETYLKSSLECIYWSCPRLVSPHYRCCCLQNILLLLKTCKWNYLKLFKCQLQNLPVPFFSFLLDTFDRLWLRFCFLAGVPLLLSFILFWPMCNWNVNVKHNTAALSHHWVSDIVIITTTYRFHLNIKHSHP